MKKIIFLSLALALLNAGCQNDLDNYNAPNGSIKGTILDADTNEPIPLPVQGSTGVIVSMYEQNTTATQSVDFYAKYDGSYENSRVFNCQYKIVANGPFVAPCEANVEVNGPTTFDLKATPCARIAASATQSGGSVTVQYSAIPANPSLKVAEVYAYWNFAPGVDDGAANYAGKKTLTDATGSVTFDLANDAAFKANLYKIQANGNKIYIRIGAKTNGKINYSQTQVVTM
jgi:hypothetical protein